MSCRGWIGWFAWAWLSASLLPAQVVDKRLRDKDPAVRQLAIEELTREGGERAEEWLLRALQDDDWGVVRAAARGLSQHGTSKAKQALVELCLEGPWQTLREEAARSLAVVDGAEGVQALIKKLGSRQRAEAAWALCELAAQGVRPESVTVLEKLARHKDEQWHAVGARAWIACATPEDQPAVLETLLASERLLVRSAAAEGLGRAPHPETIPALISALAQPDWNPVVERRLLRALLACFAAVENTEAREGAVFASIVQGLGSDEPGGRRCARWLELAMAGDAPCVSPGVAFPVLEKLAAADGPGVRAAAYRALGSLGTPAARDGLIASLGRERHGPCLEPLVRALGRAQGLASEAGVAALVRSLADGPKDSRAREALCVALAQPELAGTEEVLASQLSGEGWDVAVTAAVAIGKARGPQALDTLRALLTHEDWRYRGAAVVGLMHLATPGAFEALMPLRSDANPSVALSAERALERLAGREGHGEPPMGWVEWWGKHGAKTDLRAFERSLRNHEKYGYTVPDSLIYSGLDVVVIPGRGDKIEEVLERLNISFRSVPAGKLAEQGLHSQAVLMVGCTGELHPSDLSVVQWYVRCGGALFTSCWSLTHTANRAFPGYLRKFDTGTEVMDRVRTQPARENSPYLNGVFAGGSVPIYQLEGAHLIEVRDPLRTEVLIDSPEAADRHGSGEMAAWFWSGHGTVLDSVNHFDLQGLEMANHLRKPEEFQAYAMNHMGLSIEALRRTIKER